MRLMQNLKYKSQLALLIGLFALALVSIQVFYFFRFFQITEDRDSVHHIQMLAESAARLDEMVDSVIRTTQQIHLNNSVGRYLTEPTSTVRAVARFAIHDVMDMGVLANAYIAGIVFMDGDNLVTSAGTTDVLHMHRLNSLIEASGVCMDDTGMFTPLIYQDPLSGTYFSEPFILYIQPIQPIWRPLVGRPWGDAWLVVSLSQSNLRAIVESVYGSINTTFLVDSTGRIITASNASPVNAQRYIDTIQQNGYVDGDIVNINGAGYRVLVRENAVVDWHLISISPLAEMNRELRHLQQLAFVIGVCTFMLLAGTVLFFSKTMTQPIVNLVTNLRQIGGDLDHRIPVLSNNEIGIITQGINEMLGEIQVMTHRTLNMRDHMHELHVSEKDARLFALQSQMNPHFLYNTLSCIRGIALVRDVPEIARVSEAMNVILRASISDKINTTIEEELTIVQSYADIITIRFGGRIKFEIDIDPAMMQMQMQIMGMVLQPLAENAVYHGLETLESGGVIWISSHLEGTHVVIDVGDNGIGIPESKMTNIIKSLNEGQPLVDLDTGRQSLALVNINNRLKLRYGDKGRLTINSEEGKGTTVRMELPQLH